MFDRLFRRGASVPALTVNLPDHDATERLQDAQRRIAELESLLAETVVDFDAYRALATTKPAPKAKVAKVAVVKPVKLNALEFWAIHGQAVERIRAEFGDSWKVRAPFGKTELGTVASRLCSFTTERGTKLRWVHDHRVPAAEYWPGGVIPDAVTIQPDYSRNIPGQTPARDAAWYESRGYALHNGDWISELGWRANAVHQEAIAANAAAKAAAELAEVDGEMLAEAAD